MAVSGDTLDCGGLCAGIHGENKGIIKLPTAPDSPLNESCSLRFTVSRFRACLSTVPSPGLGKGKDLQKHHLVIAHCHIVVSSTLCMDLTGREVLAGFWSA